MQKQTPIYRIIEKDLRVQILNGTLKQGDMIPSETELCAKYQVSRMTVRQAINNLLVDGYIYSHKGRGTFVTFNKMEFDSEIEQKPYYNFYNGIVMRNNESVKVEVLSKTLIQADEIIAKRLQLQEEDSIYYVERIIVGDNIPLVYERLYFAQNMYKDLPNEIIEGSLYENIESYFGVKISNSESSIEARGLSQKVADILHLSTGEPSLYMSTTTFLDNGRAALYLRQYFHANYFRIKHKTKKYGE